MKKILFFILLIWLMTPYSANGQMLVGGMSGGVAAGASCTNVESCESTETYEEGGSPGEYLGIKDYYPASELNACQLDLFIKTAPADGDVTGYVFVMSGNNLGAEVCHTETKAYSALTNGQYNSFTITGDCIMSGGGSTTKYGVVFVSSTGSWTESVNEGTCTMQGCFAAWAANKTYSYGYATEKLRIKINGK